MVRVRRMRELEREGVGLRVRQLANIIFDIQNVQMVARTIGEWGQTIGYGWRVGTMRQLKREGVRIEPGQQTSSSVLGLPSSTRHVHRWWIVGIKTPRC